jgi:predicted esterase YcpF (UPF0227 family)
MIMKTAIVYFHGLDSNPEGRTATTLKNHFDEVDGCIFRCPLIDHRSNPLDILNKLNNFLIDLIVDPIIDDIILVGSSAGGFWARFFGIRKNLKTVLINPSVYSSVNLARFEIDPEYLEIYNDIEIAIEDTTFPYGVAIVGTEDKIIPPSVAMEKFLNVIELDGEGHVITELTPVINIIKTYVGNFPEFWDAEI